MGGELRLDIDPAQFLARYWQRKPLLIRRAFGDFSPPIDRHTLAGLALEDEVESRIIECRESQWQLFHGPFSEADFKRDTPWTLLVQAVDHYLPEVAALRRCVDFIPQWRLDDVMVSYAVDGGSVGPHYDNYDVFLLQGEGRRRWRIGQRCDAGSALVPHDELRILRDFEMAEEYLLEPGDVLYVPPGVAHWGIAEGECTTFSIGFRAPRASDLLCRLADLTLEELDPDVFYTDAGRKPVTGSGEITRDDLRRARALVYGLLENDDGRWFGEVVTEPREEPEPDASPQARDAIIAGQAAGIMPGGAKLAWLKGEGSLSVFANGLSLEVGASSLPLLETLSRTGRVDPARLPGDASRAELLDFLLEAGCLYAE